MPLTEMTINTVTDFKNHLNAYQHGKLEDFAVDDNADIDIIAMDVKGLIEAVIQIINSHATNGLIYTLYGTAKETIPDTYNAEEWEPITGASATVAIDTTKIETVTKGYSWILVRARRETSDQDSQIDVHLHAEK